MKHRYSYLYKGSSGDSLVKVTQAFNQGRCRVSILLEKDPFCYWKNGASILNIEITGVKLINWTKEGILPRFNPRDLDYGLLIINDSRTIKVNDPCMRNYYRLGARYFGYLDIIGERAFLNYE